MKQQHLLEDRCDVIDRAGYLALLHFIHGLVHLLLEQVSFGRQCLSVCP